MEPVRERKRRYFKQLRALGDETNDIYKRDDKGKSEIMMFMDDDIVRRSTERFTDSNYEALSSIPKILREDWDVVTQAVLKNNVHCFKYASATLLNNKTFVLHLLQRISNNETWKRLAEASSMQLAKVPRHILLYIPKEVLKDRAVALCCTQLGWVCPLGMEKPFHGCSHVHKLVANFKHEPEFVIATMKHRKVPLTKVHEVDHNLTKNKCVVLAAVKSDPLNLKLVNEQMKTKEVVLAAVETYKEAYEYVGNKFENDPDVALAAVQLDAMSLQRVPVDIQTNEIVRTAVTRCGKALKYAGESFRANREIVMAACTNHGAALQYAAESFRSDQGVVLSTATNVKPRDGAIKYASDELKDDKDFVISYLKKRKEFASEKKSFGYPDHVYRHLSESMISNQDVVLTACAVPGSEYMLRYIPEELIRDKEFSTKIMKTVNLSVTKDFDLPLLWKKNPEYALLLISIDWKMFKECDLSIKDNPEVLVAAFRWILVNPTDDMQRGYQMHFYPLVERIQRLSRRLHQEHKEPILDCIVCNDDIVNSCKRKYELAFGGISAPYRNNMGLPSEQGDRMSEEKQKLLGDLKNWPEGQLTRVYYTIWLIHQIEWDTMSVDKEGNDIIIRRQLSPSSGRLIYEFSGVGKILKSDIIDEFKQCLPAISAFVKYDVKASSFRHSSEMEWIYR